MSLFRRVMEKIEDALLIDHERILEKQRNEFKEKRQTAELWTEESKESKDPLVDFSLRTKK